LLVSTLAGSRAHMRERFECTSGLIGGKSWRLRASSDQSPSAVPNYDAGRTHRGRRSSGSGTLASTMLIRSPNYRHRMTDLERRFLARPLTDQKYRWWL